MAERRTFGTMPSGEMVEEVVLQGGGLTAQVLTYGSVIRDLRLAGHQPPLVLGFHSLEDYFEHSPYFGATPGRCANRIARGRCLVDGKPVELECNEKGIGHLHGGSDGIAVRNWTIADLGTDHVTLEILDPAGRAGYPGNCRITATYRLLAAGVLSVRYEAESDAPTPVNLCQHSYFNLDGSSDILNHDLMLAAQHYLPVDEETIPTGEQRPVADTPFDFRTPRRIGEARLEGGPIPYDHNFCLSSERVAKRMVGRLRSAASGVSMDIMTTEPGVQFYAGSKIKASVPGLSGKAYGPFAGLCLETQVWPDAINHSTFPNVVLRPGERLVQETDYIFRKA